MEHSSRTWSLSAESRKRTRAKACTGHGSWVTRQKGPLSTAEACGGVAGAAILASAMPESVVFNHTNKKPARVNEHSLTYEVNFFL